MYLLYKFKTCQIDLTCVLVIIYKRVVKIRKYHFAANRGNFILGLIRLTMERISNFLAGICLWKICCSFCVEFLVYVHFRKDYNFPISLTLFLPDC
jgi:hypothetical protein